MNAILEWAFMALWPEVNILTSDFLGGVSAISGWITPLRLTSSLGLLLWWGSMQVSCSMSASSVVRYSRTYPEVRARHTTVICRLTVRLHEKQKRPLVDTMPETAGSATTAAGMAREQSVGSRERGCTGYCCLGTRFSRVLYSVDSL